MYGTSKACILVQNYVIPKKAMFCWPPTGRHFGFFLTPVSALLYFAQPFFERARRVGSWRRGEERGTKKLDLPRFGATSTPKEFDTPSVKMVEGRMSSLF